ncbi:ATP-dependent endonuclease [Nissabacter sp. SGAir0207]|uniref:ATP-dependent nuclease n=1 Tax=Nissabacter sp. SGAir0207 TaxID=2126321 RepID=UPI0010CCF315|nr:ATP-dependent endonuclease [Nissabacter sp. SGAir0207]QCR36579.1 ATP-dependent endonuclease [Nissabacter sp. SGAir0207]
MILEQIDIVGFRGINRLSLSLLGERQPGSTLLIGENAWGKSSLLDALTLLLSPEPRLYHFTAGDFHAPAGEEGSRARTLQVVFRFTEPVPGHLDLPRYRSLVSAAVAGEGNHRRLYYRLEGALEADNSVLTLRSFLDAQGEPLPLAEIDSLALTLARLHPVLRLRDARFIRRLRDGALPPGEEGPRQALTRQIAQLTRQLGRNPQRLSNRALYQGVAVMQQLLEHYFTEQHVTEPPQPGRHKPPREAHTEPRLAWRSLDTLNQALAGPDSRSIRMILLGIFAALLQARGAARLSPEAQPLLLIEDPETRLHPIMLSVAWGLLNQLALQRLTTTNSGELVSLTPLEEVSRLVREPGRVAAYRLGPTGMNPADSRKITFHIRYNRPAALFARCWLLVEGETEVWILGQLARQCGFHFEAEGIKVIEFAQCGLRPLLKFARQMGIEWHAMVDGDEAGKKYAATAREMAGRANEPERDRLTALPAPDMEHFLYRAGFSDVYHRVANLPAAVPMSARRIIHRAIQRSSKPDLAIEVALAAGQRGPEAMPPLLRQMFSRVVWLARGHAD